MYGNKGKMLIPVTLQWEFRSPISSQLYTEKKVLVTINLVNKTLIDLLI